MKIKVIKENGYDDLQLNKHVNKNDVYEVSEKRAKEILATGWAVEVKEEVIETAVKETKVETAVKKTRKKTK